jgi:hypothetical protein
MNIKSIRFYLYFLLAIVAFGVAGFFGSRAALLLFVVLAFVTELFFWLDVFRRRKYH